MIILKAKIKKNSVHFKKGLNQAGKSVWLTISGFNPQGAHNFKIKCIKGFEHGFAVYQDVWMNGNDLILKQFEDKQLSLDIFSKQEEEENKQNPRYFNQRRFEVTTKNEKRYLHAPDLETAKKVAEQYGLSHYQITQVARLNRNELED